MGYRYNLIFHFWPSFQISSTSERRIKVGTGAELLQCTVPKKSKYIIFNLVQL